MVNASMHQANRPAVFSIGERPEGLAYYLDALRQRLWIYRNFLRGTLNDYSRAHQSRNIHSEIEGSIDSQQLEVEDIVEKSKAGNWGKLSLDEQNTVREVADYVININLLRYERSLKKLAKLKWAEEFSIDETSSYDARLEAVVNYVKKVGAEGLKEILESVFSRKQFQNTAKIHSDHEGERASVDLPAHAPESYQGLRGPETPPEFVQRVYREWLGKGLTRAHIRKLDPGLYTAIHNWLKKPGCYWPAEVDLPTLKEQNDRDVARLKDGDRPVLGNFTGKEAARLGAAISRRGK